MKLITRMYRNFLFPFTSILSPGGRGKGEGGFTLVEILVATTIMVIAMTSIYMSFKGGVTSWAKGTARMERYLNARVALNMMSREIRGALVNDWGIATGRRMDFCGFDAEGVNGVSGWEPNSSNDELFFIHPPRPVDIASNPYEIGYWRNRVDNTLIRHYLTAAANFIFYPVSGMPLSLNITDLQFEYYNGSSWQDTWDSRIVGFNGATADGPERGTLPQAVKITITVADDLGHEVAQEFSTIVYLPTNR